MLIITCDHGTLIKIILISSLIILNVYPNPRYRSSTGVLEITYCRALKVHIDIYKFAPYASTGTDQHVCLNNCNQDKLKYWLLFLVYLSIQLTAAIPRRRRMSSFSSVLFSPNASHFIFSTHPSLNHIESLAKSSAKHAAQFVS